VAAGDREILPLDGAQQQLRAFALLPNGHDAQEGYVVVVATPDPESTSIPRDDKRTLDRLMSALSEEQREVLVLGEIEDMDYLEIGPVTNPSIGTLMSRLARARAAAQSRSLQELEGQAHAVR
jgi:DNA-directed RNA polymerase specialized sigma24 family protein